MSRVVAALALAAVSQVPLPPNAAPAAGTVSVYGWVENLQGKPTASVKATDFEALVDGIRVPIKAVVPPRTTASIVLLLDTSRSAGWTPRPLDDQLGLFASSLDPKDRLMIATFGGRATAAAFRPAGEDIRGAVRRLLELEDDEGYGNSPVWDAIHGAVAVLSEQPVPRSVLLLTDGRATGNRYGLADVAGYAVAHGVALNVVLKHSMQMISQSGGTAALVQPGAPIQELANYTGGMYFTYPERQEDRIREIFTLIASAADTTLGFTFAVSTLDGSPHRLDIRSARTDLTVHAPSAFVAR